MFCAMARKEINLFLTRGIAKMSPESRKGKWAGAYEGIDFNLSRLLRGRVMQPALSKAC
jgi:hypothetical protein